VRVLVVDASDRGGIAHYTEALVDGLRAEGVDVTFLAPRTGLPRLPWGEETAGWNVARRRAVAAAAWVRRAAVVASEVRRSRPDVVHVQTPIAGVLDPLLLRWCRRRATLVRTVHNAEPHERTRASARDRRQWSLAHHLVVHGREAATIVGVAGAAVHVIPPDPPAADGPDPATARRALGIDTGARVAVLLGLLRPYKGVGLLADAWPLVRAELPEARLAVAGSVLERFPDLERLLAADGVDGHVRWLDDDEVLAWAAAADVCLLPYAHGAHSAVLHRAVAAGTPVLSSPALAEETDRLGAGRVVPLEPGAWAAAIVDALRGALARPSAPPTREQAAATAALYAEITAGAAAPRR